MSVVRNVALTDMYSVYEYTSQKNGVYTNPVKSERLNEINLGASQAVEGGVFRTRKIYDFLREPNAEELIDSKKLMDRITQVFQHDLIGFFRGSEEMLVEVIEKVHKRFLLSRETMPLYLKHKKGSLAKCSIIFDPKNELFHVFSKKSQVKVDSGSFKLVVKSIAVPFSRERGLFFAVRKITQIKLSGDKDRLLLCDPIEEVQFSMQYRCAPKVYFAALHPLSLSGENTVREDVVCKKTTEKKVSCEDCIEVDSAEDEAGEEIFRVDTVEEMYLSLYEALTQKKIVPDETSKIAFDLLHGLIEFHHSGLAHLDIGLNNALIKKENTLITAVWTDFGMAIKKGVFSRKDSPLLVGLYGTLSKTPPECFRGRFMGDLYKLDSWAFGICLFELLFFSSPKWISMLDGHYRKCISEGDSKNAYTLTPETWRLFDEQLDQEIRYLRAQQWKEENSIRKAFMEVCVHLLEKEPHKRWSLDQAEEYLKSETLLQPIGVVELRSASASDFERERGLFRPMRMYPWSC